MSHVSVAVVKNCDVLSFQCVSSIDKLLVESPKDRSEGYILLGQLVAICSEESGAFNGAVRLFYHLYTPTIWGPKQARMS